MEQNLQRRVVGLKDKMPDIKKTLDTVRFLKLRTVWRAMNLMGPDMALTGQMRQDESDPIETTFELNDTLYAKAQIPPTDEVYLWLGVGFPLPFHPALWPCRLTDKRRTLCCHIRLTRLGSSSTRN
jgi:hypothetical protein